MLKREELQAVAKFKGLSLRLTELDYLQDLALINIYREFGSKLVFKGGTCLYKAYKLDRFSEDLDFTAGKGFKPKNFFTRLPGLFSLLDVKAKATVEAFERSTNVYVQARGPLYDGSKESLTSLAVNISLRERVLLPVQTFPYAPIYREIRPFNLFAMDEKEILAEKIRAIHERNKARDVYDLWHLLKRRGVPAEPGLISRKMAHAGLRFTPDGFWAKVDEKKGSWERDLGGLVGGPLPSFPQVKKEIEERIQKNGLKKH
ncbi:MAG: nucleotidyl transferase AbiEii/AbiGii toxin family protein [Candidatus Diapherotrites archaeon]|uniref:Nucleotidyl transferase AbiEii/AbiGii toxin family protein n=1 Tax=Candidatus Iainarchaeum sp. TaxID=3101447 RepID=A0A8T4LGW6_9ARCH|nr:nucleotidyl transferase AbiEii/AbiGii toxin family protein [Candidatus Diapherotrites archaeon]